MKTSDLLPTDSYTAGVLLAQKLTRYKNTDAVVMGISNGGIVVAEFIARELGLLWQALPCHKINHPYNFKKSIGSVSGEDVMLSECAHEIPGDYIAHQISLIRHTIANEQEIYNGENPLSWTYKTIIVVDDMSNTGRTIAVSLKTINRYMPLKTVVAVPFIAAEAVECIQSLADEIVFLNEEREAQIGVKHYNSYAQIHST